MPSYVAFPNVTFGSRALGLGAADGNIKASRQEICYAFPRDSAGVLQWYGEANPPLISDIEWHKQICVSHLSFVRKLDRAG